MRHLLYILIVGIIVFSSCDGRTTRHDSLKASVSKFKHTIQPTTVTEYYPKHYSEIQTDTILNNGYRVKIKNFTNMNVSVLKASKNGTINYNHFYRQITSEIIVYKYDKLIFEATIDNDFIKKHLYHNMAFNTLIHNGISVDEISSLEKNKLVLNTSFTKPKSTTLSAQYQIIIDSNGLLHIKTLDYART
ncbi:hypothetical protein MHTCC0001_03470 [Flavobacteriaceae bacterium MHTCC 0001]